MTLVIAAFLAGLLTTIAGFGGGLILVLMLMAVMDPAEALTIGALALVVGNVHRAWMLRASLDLRVAGSLALGIVPATALGAWLASQLPSATLRLLVIVVACAGLGTKLASIRLVLPPRHLVLAGVGIGAIGSAGCGAGLVAGPMLLAGGMGGARYVATMAAIGVIHNVARGLGYAAVGWVSMATLAAGALGAACIMAGNLAGRALAARLEDTLRQRIELAVPAAGVALAIFALVR